MKKGSPDLLVFGLAATLAIVGCSGGGGGGGSSAAPPPTPPALDTDQDGVADTLDAFPTDPAASKDTDGDGFPDEWNAGASQVQKDASPLKLDAFPTLSGIALDSDGDGLPDAFLPGANQAQIHACFVAGISLDPDADGDGLANFKDAFPADPAVGVDTDQDGLPDSFLPGATQPQRDAFLAAGHTLDLDDDNDGVADTLDAFPLQAIAAVDADGDGYPDAWIGSPTLLEIAASGLGGLDFDPGNPTIGPDTDGDLSPDTLDVDDDGDLVLDVLDAFPLQRIAAVDADSNSDDTGTVISQGDGLPDAWIGNPTPQEIAASGLTLDADPSLGLMDIPTGVLDIQPGAPVGVAASPLDFGAGEALPFTQQMLLFEEFGTEAMPAAAAPAWNPLPQPRNPQNGPVPAQLDTFLRQIGVAPLPQRLANVGIPSPWKPAIEAFLDRTLVQPAAGVPGPAEGRPSGEDWAHQSWNELYPKVFFKTTVAQSRLNQGLRDSRQRHGYALGEFGPGGLYHNVAGVPATAGSSAGVAIAFHPKLPVQEPNSIWTFDGTLPPKLLAVRYGEPILMRNYNALPLDEAANNGFGRHTISTHEHNGHVPGESDGFAGAFFYPGQFYDYRWPLQLAGYSNNVNAAGAINYNAAEPRAAIPAEPGEQFTVLVNGVPTTRIATDPDGDGHATVRIPGDWRETMSSHWFHDHMLDHTAENVYKGNATCMNYYSALDRGNEAVDDGVNLRFPSGTALSWGNRDYDINLVIADKAWSPTTGQLWMNTVQHNGFLGDRMTVNFLYKPYLDVRERRYRFRLLNGSVSRIMAIGLVREIQGNGGQWPGPAGSGVSYEPVPFHMIANDGNIMEHAIHFDGNTDFLDDGKPEEWEGQLPSQTIAERYDIIVDFDRNGVQAGDKLYFVNIMEHLDGKGTSRKVKMEDILSGAYAPIVNPDGLWANGDPGVGKFLELRVHAYDGEDLSMNPEAYEPGGLTMVPLSIDRNDPSLATATHHTFEFVKASGGNGGHGTPWAIKVDGGGDNLADPQQISAIEHGDTQVWEIKTGGGWTHPVHIHFEEGVILTRDGEPPPAWELWARKDMYRIGPENDSSLKVEVAFRARDYLGQYVQHCHNTTHEDHAMLLRWDSRIQGAALVATPMPTWDGVNFMPSFALPSAESGD